MTPIPHSEAYAESKRNPWASPTPSLAETSTDVAGSRENSADVAGLRGNQYRCGRVKGKQCRRGRVGGNQSLPAMSAKMTGGKAKLGWRRVGRCRMHLSYLELKSRFLSRAIIATSAAKRASRMLVPK